MVFSVIEPGDSLSASDRQIAIESGPEFVDVDGDYALLLEQAGWRVEDRINVTAEFARSTRTSLEVMNSREEALTKVLGLDEFSERVARRQATLAAIDRGVLKREIFAAITATAAQKRAV
jgi:hypothetical protein